MYVLQLLAAYFVAEAARKTCHRDSASKRIFNDAKIEDFPYLVLILEIDGPFHWYRGVGAIIGRRLVLTSGYILRGKHFKKENYIVRSGTAYNKGVEATKGIKHPLKEITKHPKFYLNRKDHDIAILQLVKSFKFSDTTQPIPLAMTSPKSGADGIIAGWGAVDANTTKYIPVLQTATVPILSWDDCLKKTGWGKRLLEENFCAGGKSMALEGDSGSPIVWEGTIAGIYARGMRIYDENFQTIFTNVTFHVDWIKSTVAEMKETDVKYV